MESADPVILGVVVFSTILCAIGGIFYFSSIKYMKKYKAFGIIGMMLQADNLPEPGKTYAKIASVLLGLTPLAAVVTLLILKLSKLI